VRPELRALWILPRCLLLAVGGLAISPPSERLEVDIQHDMSGLWVVHEATVQEDYVGMYAVLKIENASATGTVDAAFYAEYLDASERRCFAMVFAQDENEEGRVGPFLPGEVRHLRSATFYLHPASPPGRLNLRILSAPIADDRGKIRAGGGVHAPPVLRSYALTGKPWERIWLDGELQGGDAPLLDLVFARVRVDSEGAPKDVEVMNFVGLSARSWFEQFIHNQRFQPAITGTQAIEADMLVLVRAVVSLRCIREKPWPPRESPSVREYVALQAGKDLLPIVTVILNAVTPDFWRHKAPGYFEVLGVGSDWGVAVSPEFEQEATAGPEGPPLRAIVPPSEAYTCP